MATQKDVARKAGVSFITVSRVINGAESVSVHTKARVEEAIRELNYYPNRQAQALNNGLTRTVAMVTPRMFALPLFDNFYLMSLLSGVEMEGRETGWDVLLTTDFDREGAFDFLRVWHQRKVDGLVFVGLKRFPAEQIREIESRGIPCVSISDRINSHAISWVDSNNDAAARDAVRRLVTMGHKSFAFIGVDPRLDYNPNFQDRQEAVIEELNKHGLDLEILPAESADPGAGISPALKFVGMNPRPTAVISGNDSLAFTFMRESARHGLRCPEDYSIVGFDAEPAGRISVPSLASYSQPLVDMGRKALKVLVEQLVTKNSGGQPRQTVEFPLNFVPGSSVSSFPYQA